MHWPTRVLVVAALLASAAGHAEPIKPLDVSALDAAEKLWAHELLQNYTFRFQYEEFASPCHLWAFDVRLSRGVPERRNDCRQYRTEFSSVPLLSSTCVMPSKKTTTLSRQTSIRCLVTRLTFSLHGLRRPTISLASRSLISQARSRRRIDFDTLSL